MRKRNIEVIKISFIIFVVILIGLMVYQIFSNKKNTYNGIINTNSSVIQEIKIDYIKYYNDFVKTQKEKNIYITEDSKFVEYGIVYPDITLSLEKDEYIDLGYFKIKDSNYYIDYNDIEQSSEEEENLFWKNYIPYNESIRTDTKTNFYLNDKIQFTLNTAMELPIIIKDDNYYGVLYKEKLYYVKKDEVELFKNKNTDKYYTTSISALVYHATYDSNNKQEKNKCLNNNATICLSDKMFDEQMKYLSDNNYYTATMKDIEMFVDGKIQLPKKTVLITIDDGYYADATVKILEKYNLHATLFLIGALSEVEEWKTDAWYSKSLELHSHTYNMHAPNVCEGGQGSALKCLAKEKLLEDLRKSREQLNNTTVFCYPFFEYNDYAIEILKEAGFTMAFTGGRSKIKVGSNKMKLPRYGIINTTTLNQFIGIIN